jgi:hypothetical protein
MTTPGQYAQELSQRASGPHDDQATAQVAGLAAEAIRYLSYAVSHGGITEPATVYAVAGELSTAAYRLPQLLSQISDWLTAEISPGGIVACDRPAGQVSHDARTIFGEAAGHAASLAAALIDAHNLTAALRTADRAREGSAAP